MMWVMMGTPPTSTIGLGRVSVLSRRRVPMPPHRIMAFTRGEHITRRGRLSWLKGPTSAGHQRAGGRHRAERVADLRSWTPAGGHRLCQWREHERYHAGALG